MDGETVPNRVIEKTGVEVQIKPPVGVYPRCATLWSTHEAAGLPRHDLAGCEGTKGATSPLYR